MVDRIRYPTVSYLPFYYVFFQFLLLTIFNLQANILTTKDIPNLGLRLAEGLHQFLNNSLLIEKKKIIAINCHLKIDNIAINLCCQNAMNNL